MALKKYEGKMGGQFEVYTDKGKSVVVKSKGKTKTFTIGDECVFDSWNLIYTAEILSITDKSVIVNTKKQRGKNIRMKLDYFATMNWNFDSDEIRAENAETSFRL